MHDLLFILTLLAALGCGLIAGLFFAFSVAVMTALGQVPAAQGIAVMQAINRVIVNPLFLGVFFGTALTSLMLIVMALAGRADGWVVVGGLIYLVGSTLVTLICNVPRNNQLAATDPSKPESVAVWDSYLIQWTFWNHVRTLASALACVLLMLGMNN